MKKIIMLIAMLAIAGIASADLVDGGFDTGSIRTGDLNIADVGQGWSQASGLVTLGLNAPSDYYADASFAAPATRYFGQVINNSTISALGADAALSFESILSDIGGTPNFADNTLNVRIFGSDSTLSYASTISLTSGNPIDTGAVIELVSSSFNITSAGADTFTTATFDASTYDNYYFVIGVGNIADGGGQPGQEELQLDNFSIVAAGSSGDPYDDWVSLYNLTDTNALLTTDIEPDGLNNLQEYALGGNPTNDDAAAVSPASFVASDTGTNWLYIAYNQRTNDTSLTYQVGSKTNLVDDLVPNTSDASPAGEGAAFGDYKAVTNRTEAVGDVKFLELVIEK